LEALRLCTNDGMKIISFENMEKWLEISDYLSENGKLFFFNLI
jgi:hypothetical protein